LQGARKNENMEPEPLATWEAEIRRIKVGGQPGQIVHKTTSPK
jgi:hypothetical protein